MRTTKRKPSPVYDPLKVRAKALSDQLWERAMEIARVLAPDVPVDHVELDERQQWILLERVALNLSPFVWDDPDAIRDLYMLRKKFIPKAADPSLLEYAQRMASMKKKIGRPWETPLKKEK